MTNRRWFFLAVLAFLAASFRLHSQPQTSSIETIAGSQVTGLAGSEFSFGATAGLASDAAGNIYFTIQPLSQVFRLGTDGIVSVYAGNGARGRNDEEVLAAASPLLNPSGLAVDGQGNLFIASANGLLRVDALTGMLSTVLKSRYQRPGSADSPLSINSMTFGPDGLLYICDGHDHRIKSYSLASGEIATLAGNGQLGATRNGASATSSPLKYPSHVAVASDGTVYFTTQEPVVFRINPRNRKIETLNLRVKKEPSPGQYDVPSQIAFDSAGSLYVAQVNRSRVLRVDLKSKKVSVYAGTGENNFNGDGIKAAKAAVAAPRDIAVDVSGNLIISDEARIRRVEAATKLISTVVGNGLRAADAASTPAAQSRLWEPADVVSSADGSVYITSSFSDRLLRIDPYGYLTTVAGGGDPGLGDQPGPALQVSLAYPQGIWVDGNGDVYFSDRDNRVVRRLSAGAKSVTNFAVTPKKSNAAGVVLYYAAALIADANYLYMSDPNGHQVWRIEKSNGSVEPYAGTGSSRPVNAGEPIADGGAAQSAELISPSGLALDSAGNLLIADGGYVRFKRGRILRVNAADGTITTLLSNLQQPSGLAFESPGVLCFSEAGANQVRCIDLKSRDVRVVAGTGQAGFSGDGGPAECAQLNRPSGISFDGAGNLYIADTGNQRIRRARLVNSVVHCPGR